MNRRYLLVVPSTCQMYSGTGTVTFDWLRYAKGDFSFSVMMDCEHKVSVDVTAAFCREQQIPLYLSGPQNLPGCPDSGLSGLAAHLQSHQYEIIEGISWANGATNLALLEAIPAHSRLVFTALSQPLWTIGSRDRHFMVPVVFARMLRTSDAIFVLSSAEAKLPEFDGIDGAKIHCTPGAVDPAKYYWTGKNEPGLITCVCDCREPRKRLDLLLSAFGVAVGRNPELRLVLAGRGSDAVPVPAEMAPFVLRLGYISSTELRELYQRSNLLALLSDYEAFGLPIAEALCCGSQVLLNRQEVMEELFADLPGVHWTTNTDSQAAGSMMCEFAARICDSRRIAEAATERFGWEATYGKKRDILLRLLDRHSAGAGAAIEVNQSL